MTDDMECIMILHRVNCYLFRLALDEMSVSFMRLGEKIKEDNALLCPMLDARRMEVYAALYDRGLKTVRDVSADIIEADTYKQWLDERPVYFFGNGAEKCKDVITHPNAHFIEGIEPLAKWMQPLAERRFLNEQFEDVAYFVPFYLKDFVAIKPKKLL